MVCHVSLGQLTIRAALARPVSQQRVTLNKINSHHTHKHTHTHTHKSCRGSQRSAEKYSNSQHWSPSYYCSSYHSHGLRLRSSRSSDGEQFPCQHLALYSWTQVDIINWWEIIKPITYNNDLQYSTAGCEDHQDQNNKCSQLRSAILISTCHPDCVIY